MECCWAVADAGANGLVLCDTNGDSMPWDVGTITADDVDQVRITVGMYTYAY